MSTSETIAEDPRASTDRRWGVRAARACRDIYGPDAPGTGKDNRNGEGTSYGIITADPPARDEPNVAVPVRPRGRRSARCHAVAFEEANSVRGR